MTSTDTETFFETEEETEFTFVALKASALACLVVWTIIANALVFVVLYKNPRLQTVPNFLVGNLAFSDLCLGLVVLPLSAVYAITLYWPFGKIVCEIWLSCDVLCSTASIWNLSIIGLDRYWAITSPITYMTKRNMRSAVIMIAGVWALSMLISVAPFFGWSNASEKGNFVFSNKTVSWQCQFLEIPSYTIYSATGSFYIPLIVMFFVYFQIYRAFAEHKARQIYRQKVIRKHIESTILHEISHVLPTSDEFAKEQDDEEEDSEEDEDEDEDDEDDYDEDEPDDQFDPKQNGSASPESKMTGHVAVTNSCSVPASGYHSPVKRNASTNAERLPLKHANSTNKKTLSRQSTGATSQSHTRSLSRQKSTGASSSTPKNGPAVVVPISKPLTYERVRRHKQRKERREMMRQSLQKKPPAISAAKEKRGVKVLGIILGCFAVCWTPFFIMYLVTGFCGDKCRPNPHIEQFITWLGYSNSAMNPIIYTVIPKSSHSQAPDHSNRNQFLGIQSRLSKCTEETIRQ